MDHLKLVEKHCAFYVVFMFLTIEMLIPLYRATPIEIRNLLTGPIIWTFSGFRFGYMMSTTKPSFKYIKSKECIV